MCHRAKVLDHNTLRYALKINYWSVFEPDYKNTFVGLMNVCVLHTMPILMETK